MLIDPGAYAGRTLPADNCVSLMVATELMSDLEEAVGILETALLLPAPDQEKLRDTFLSWFRLPTGRIGVDLEFLEDKAIMEQLERTGALRTTLEERFQALHARYAARRGAAPKASSRALSGASSGASSRASSENGSCCVA